MGLSPVALLGTSELHGADTLVAETAGLALSRGKTTALAVLQGSVCR